MLENINPEGNAAEIKMLRSELHLSVKVFFLDSVAQLYMCRKNPIQTVFFI